MRPCKGVSACTLIRWKVQRAFFLWHNSCCGYCGFLWEAFLISSHSMSCVTRKRPFGLFTESVCKASYLSFLVEAFCSWYTSCMPTLVLVRLCRLTKTFAVRICHNCVFSHTFAVRGKYSIARVKASLDGNSCSVPRSSAVQSRTQFA